MDELTGTSQKTSCDSTGKALTQLALIVILIVAPRVSVAQWVWVQQQNFKSLERMGINSDPVMLIYRDVGLREATLNSQVQSVRGGSFREFVFQLKDNSLDSEPLDLLIQRIYRAIAEKLSTVIQSSSVNFDWNDWLKQGLRFGVGKTPEDAFVNLKLGEFQMSYSIWKKTATELRSILFKISSENNISWEQMLEASRKYGRAPEQMRFWFKKNQLPLDQAWALSQYGQLLTLGDYLDPSRFSSPRVGMEKLNTSLHWNYLLVIDIAGMGKTNRIAQDQWLSRGGAVDEIAQVSRAGDLKKEVIAEKVTRAIDTNMISGSYVFGDAFVFGLNLNNPRKTELLIRLNSIDDIHFSLQIRDGQNLEQAINKGTKQMKSNAPSTCAKLIFM